MAFCFFMAVLRASALTSPGTITGTVEDSSGAILVSAKVAIEPTEKQTATDDQGIFHFNNLAPGKYTLTTSYAGFQQFITDVTVTAGKTATVTAKLSLESNSNRVVVSAPRVQGDAEAESIERMSAQIVQVAPASVITSLPNTNIADAIGRLPSVSLERDEGEGKYVQVRGTEPRLTNLTINGVNVPSVEVTVRNVKMDAIPSSDIDLIEVFKTLGASQDADGIGGSVNLVTPMAQDVPTYAVDGTVGYNPQQHGFWRGGFDGTYGRRFGVSKKLGVLLGGSWDRTNRGIDDLEPSQAIGTLANGQPIAYVSSEDLRSYEYYRTRYGFVSGLDYRFTPQVTAYIKGFYSDFHDYGEAHVYTPNSGAPLTASNSTITFDNTGSWLYRHYIRRPDQQIFSFLIGASHNLSKDVISYNFALSRGHNIGGQDFPSTYFSGPTNVTFSESLANPNRPRLYATDGTNGFDPKLYTVNESDSGSYHATQLNIQGAANLAHSYTAAGHPSTFSLGVKVRNSYSTQRENDTHLAYTGMNPFTLDSVLGSYTNPTYYNKSFAINGLAYGPTSSYDKILKAVAANASGFTEDVVGDSNTYEQAFFNADERISAGYLENVTYFNHFRLDTGVRFDAGSTHFLANTVDNGTTGPCFKDPAVTCPGVRQNRQNANYFNALPSVALQWQFHKDSNLRAVYSRGLARPNIGDLVPATIVDPNQTPYPTVSTGNPKLVPTLADNIDVLAEHYFQPLGAIRAGYFFKELHNPIYPVATLIPNYNNTGKTYQQTQAINGPNAHIQGIELQWEQRFAFLPGLLSGFGVNANYSYSVSQATFPDGFDGGRTDHPALDRTAPNNYNFNLTYDRNRFSGRFAISHNDPSIAAYQWNTGTGPINDPILGLKGPTGDNYFYAHTQFDAQGSYRLYRNLQAVASGLNLSNEVFGFYNGRGIYPVQREYYRPTVSFGLRWSATGN